MGVPFKTMVASEIPCWNKLGKCIVTSKNLKKGQKIEEEDLKMKVTEPKGIDAVFYEELIGFTLKRDLNADDVIFRDDYDN